MKNIVPDKKEYYARLDGLRCIAISLVLLEHFAGVIGSKISAGFYGVDLFFVISGFLITQILVAQANLPFNQYYLKFSVRRILRIFPLYYFIITLLWLLNVEDVRSFTYSLYTYTTNYRLDFQKAQSPIRHLWSLSVEEQFYLFWPFIIYIIAKNKTLLIVTLIIVIAAGYLQLLFDIFPSISKFNYVGLFPRMSSLAIGALAAVIGRGGALKKFFTSSLVEFLMSVILFMALVSSYKIKFLIFGITSSFLVTKAAFYHFNFKNFDDFLNNRQVVIIGTISYGIYIYHVPVNYLFTKLIFDPIWTKINFSDWGRLQVLQYHSWILKLPVCTLLSFGIASTSYRYFEKPINNLKEKFFPI